MSLIKSKNENGRLTIYLSGHIDSANAAQVETEINEVFDKGGFEALTVDCAELSYISSAGLRIILRLRKSCADMVVENVSSEVYEIFDMTGFTEMIEIKKAYRVISVEGCEVIGQGANGKVYRIDRDTIVKVYLNPDSLPDIERERELARKAFVLGIPTAIPYDIVRVGEGYGSVFELLNAKSFAKLLIADAGELDNVVDMSVDLLKKIHSTELKPGDMPDMKKVVLGWAEFMKDHLPAEQYEKLRSMVEAVPEDNHMMHGDYHIKNVMLQNGEVLLIDMDTLCMGHPVFEFGSVFNAYIGYSELDHENVKNFLGIPFEMSSAFWHKTLERYFEGESAEKIAEIEKKAMLIGYVRIMRRTIRRGLDKEPKGAAEVANCREKIGQILSEIDSLTW